MIIFMSDIICVTNRTLCDDVFLQRIERIAAAHPAGIILREKDLSESVYQALAAKVMEICKVYDVPCILHSFVDVAIALHAAAIHVPLPVLREMTAEEKAHFTMIGASCHSVEEAVEAETLNCTYITAGHIFETDCKKGLAGRGLAFLETVCKTVSVPVYAIGGITEETMCAVRAAGASGACTMSGFMKCQDAAAYVRAFEKVGESDELL